MNITFRAMNLNVFAGKPNPHVFFQPRFEPWYAWQSRSGSMPAYYRELGLLGTYDALGCSMRYVHYYTGMPDPVRYRLAPEVKVNERDEHNGRIRIIETPYGELTERLKFTADCTWRTVEFPVKQPEDLRKLRWLCKHMSYTFSKEHFMQGSDFLGERGEPQFWLPKSPYQALAQVWMRLEDLIYALADCPGEVEQTMQALDETYDPLYEQIAASGVVKIVNFGENIHEQLLSPRYFERYLIPWYEKRAGRLRQAGIYTHIHIDGYCRSLLKYLKHLPFDGYEALTPKPQGDVTLQEIKEHIGDKVLLDGIPAVLFLSTYSREALMETVEEIVALFHPRLVLGVSDEVPQGAEAEEAIERIRMISQWCRQHQG
ncbi:MAG: hypothetical protein N2508_12020 [Anaerolineae bacterium]|nr:hypothetical protein [Anaerolineae bacterium]